MWFAALIGGLLFAVVAHGLAWPLVARLALSPVEKFVAAVPLSLLATFFLGWVVYVFSLPTATLWLAPALAILQLGLARRSWLDAMCDVELRGLLLGQLLIMLWNVGWLALVASYSGGDWVGDWLAHWQRLRFFLEHQPLTTLILGGDPVTARPPLANVVTGVFARLTQVDFAHYQFFNTLLNSLIFLPAALLARRFGGNAAMRVLVVFLLLNPLFVQNATYAWTKLSTGFFVLTGLYFFLRATDAGVSRSDTLLVAASLGAGVLCHYSAGPYLLVLAIAWLVLGRRRVRDPAWIKSTALAATLGAAILIAWFGWAMAAYGVHETFLSNPSVTEQAPSAGAQVLRAIMNIRNTLVPHFLRHVDFSPFVQRSVWGTWRDWTFQVYQRNLFFAVGSVAGIAALVLVARQWTATAPAIRRFWAVFIAAVILLGVAVHGSADSWGNVHICEQPLVVLALAFLAARWIHLSPRWRIVLIAGAFVDLVVGILLQFGSESFLLDRWLTPNRPPADYLTSYSDTAQFNLQGKLQLKLGFFGDGALAYPAVILALLATLLMLALIWARSFRATALDLRSGN